MTNKIYSFLKYQNISAPHLVDTLIISAYIKFNKLDIQYNELIRSHILRGGQDEQLMTVLNDFTNLIAKGGILFGHEELIKLFEFVISPADKITNGAIYTPAYIRDYIVDKTIHIANKDVSQLKICDISCGCGGFLLTTAKHLKKATNRTYKQIYAENLFGLDITDYSIERARLLLSIYAIENGEDANFEFNLEVANALSYNWKAHYPVINDNAGFDVIVGNPPYVASRNMDKETLALVSQMQVSRSGHPDMYIPFFEIGFRNLSPIGALGYITVNTFFKSVNGRELRKYFEENRVDLKIINFGGEQVFKARNTYTCLCFLSHNGTQVKYIKATSSTLPNILDRSFNTFSYSSLNHSDGWNLVNSDELANFIQKIESTGKPFKDLFTTRNGIATLKNEIYKFKPVKENGQFYFLLDDNREVPIEIGICKDIINANKVKSVRDIRLIKEKIIFPYEIVDKKVVLIDEDTLRRRFPRAYIYLTSKRHILATRDKGETNRHEAWYAYGRRQSMDINAYKLFFAHISEKPHFVLCRQKELLFYNGLAVIAEKEKNLKVLKKLMESKVFFEYIRSTTKNYSSGFLSLSKNYIKNFGIPELSKKMEDQLLKAKNPDKILEKIYGVADTIDKLG